LRNTAPITSHGFSLAPIALGGYPGDPKANVIPPYLLFTLLPGLEQFYIDKKNIS
jgi:hypothetical protein